MDAILNFFFNYSLVILVIIGVLIMCIIVFYILLPVLIKNVYQRITHLLTLHKGAAKFLSHGGVHFIFFFIFLVVSLWMIADVAQNNIATFNQVVYTFYGDTLKNYKLSTIKMKSDLSRRPGNVYNPNDMILEYGYKRDSLVDSHKTLKLFNDPRIKGDYDLVSVIHVVADNETPIKTFNKLYTVYSPTKNKQVCNSIKYTSHNKYYYGRSSLEDSTHYFKYSFYGKDVLKEWSKMNPYFKFWIGVNMVCKYDIDDNSEITIILDNGNNKGQCINEPLNIEEIIPEPSYRTVSEIKYKGKEKIGEVINNGGVYVSALDPEKKAETDKHQILYSVFAGTFIAFCIDIFIQIILKWRKIVK
jgi:hypothetical protein